MNRDELQGVVAHEIGHIRNQDVKLITTAGIMVGAIVLLAELGLRAMWITGGGRRSRSSGGGNQAQAIIAVVAILLLILSPILAQLIYFALSRRREYLADASGALFTRYPEGLASALEKLGGTRVPLSDRSRVTAPMYISAPVREGQMMSASSSFSTHPPLEKRIRILRGMGGSADLGAYEKSFERAMGKSVIGARSLTGAAPVAAREAAPAEPDSEPTPTREHERAREASNAFLHASGYAWVNCASCGAVLKVPPSLHGRLKRCPRCNSSVSIE
jgi:heat shock protein HtpX